VVRRLGGPVAGLCLIMTYGPCELAFPAIQPRLVAAEILRELAASLASSQS